MNLIRVGDDTDHGGKVETGSQTMQFDGRYVARKGDCVSCQQHPDVSPNVIEEGDTSFTDAGVPIARHGHHATWGAVYCRASSSRTLLGPARHCQSGSICICWTACWRRWC